MRQVSEDVRYGTLSTPEYIGRISYSTRAISAIDYTINHHVIVIFIESIMCTSYGQTYDVIIVIAAVAVSCMIAWSLCQRS